MMYTILISIHPEKLLCMVMMTFALIQYYYWCGGNNFLGCMCIIAGLRVWLRRWLRTLSVLRKATHLFISSLMSALLQCLRSPLNSSNTSLWRWQQALLINSKRVENKVMKIWIMEVKESVHSELDKINIITTPLYYMLFVNIYFC